MTSCMLLYNHDDQPLIRGSVNTHGPGESGLKSWMFLHHCHGSQCRGSVWKLWYHYHGDPCVSGAPVQEEVSWDLGSLRASLSGRDTHTYWEGPALHIAQTPLPGLWKKSSGF